jgi:hypothetical protein
MMTHFLLLAGTLLPLLASAQSQSAPDTIAMKPDPTAHPRIYDAHQTDLLGVGTWHAGLNARGVGWGGYADFTGRVTPRIAYFLKDGWSVGLEGQYEATGRLYQRTSIGLTSRYYFVRDQRLAMFGLAGFNIGHSRYQSPELTGPGPYYLLVRDTEGTTYQARLGVGVSYRLGQRWTIEGVIERTHTTTPGYTPRYGTGTFAGWQGSAGVSFQLGK